MESIPSPPTPRLQKDTAPIPPPPTVAFRIRRGNRPPHIPFRCVPHTKGDVIFHSYIFLLRCDHTRKWKKPFHPRPRQYCRTWGGTFHTHTRPPPSRRWYPQYEGWNFSRHNWARGNSLCTPLPTLPLCTAPGKGRKHFQTHIDTVLWTRFVAKSIHALPCCVSHPQGGADSPSSTARPVSVPPIPLCVMRT